MPENNRFNSVERRAALSLGILFFLRMLGLFMLLPVLSLYVHELEYATPFWIGLALGIYALTQAIFQIPMGHLSDRLGRKPVIALGLLIFIAGSVLAAVTENVFFVIAGRALQGCGAISSAALAMAADLSRETQRTKLMAVIGISIGLAFSSAFVLGPVIDGQLGLRGVFGVVAGLGVIAVLILFSVVPTPQKEPSSDEQSHQDSGEHPPVSRPIGAFVLGGFFLHAILAISFVVIPLYLATELALPSSQHYRIYLPVILISLLMVGPMVMLSTRGDRQTLFIRLAISALALGLVLFAVFPPSGVLVYVGLAVFFIGFNYLEAALPSQVSKESRPEKRGRTMGSYATLQFIGTFLGALLGGILLERYGYEQVILAAMGLACLWLVLTLLATTQRALVHSS